MFNLKILAKIIYIYGVINVSNQSPLDCKYIKCEIDWHIAKLELQKME